MGKKDNTLITIGALGVTAGVGLYLLSKKKTPNSDLTPVNKAPEVLIKEPEIRPSASEIESMSKEAAETVNQSILEAQAKLIEAELKMAAEQDIVKEYTEKYNYSLTVLAEKEKGLNEIQSRLNVASTSVSNQQAVVTSKKALENTALNNMNANLNALKLKEQEIVDLYYHYKDAGWLHVFILANPIYQSNKMALETELSKLQGITYDLERTYNNAVAETSAQNNILNGLIQTKDSIASELNTYRTNVFEKAKAESLALKTTLNQYAISFAAAKTIVDTLRAELQKQGVNV